MNEREMLELAAKAAEMSNPNYMEIYQNKGINRGPTESLWNPLTDDGDALRLAVKLRFSVSFNLAFVEVECWQDECGVTREVIEYFHEPEEAAAAARLAITRAAAEVGKAMQP